jgi:hypothetical protein
MGSTLALVSNRPALLRRAVKAFLPGLSGRRGWDVVVCDGAESFAANREFLSGEAKASGVNIRHLSPAHGREAARIVGRALSRDVDSLFRDNYGGMRNLALLFCAAQGRNAVFVDDDTLPRGDFFGRYEARFSEGWKLVPGSFAGHVAITSAALLYWAGECASEFEAGFAARQEAASRASLALRGVPPSKSSSSRGMFIAGNVGISAALARAVPFFPTCLRVEDAVYWLSANAALQGDGRGVLRPQSDASAASLLPSVLHEREASDKPVLFARLANELRGSAVAKLIGEMGIPSLSSGTPVGGEELARFAAQASESSWEEFNMDNAKQRLLPLLSLLEGEDKEEVERILSMGKASASISARDAEKALADYSFSARAWPYACGALEDEAVRAELLAL